MKRKILVAALGLGCMQLTAAVVSFSDGFEGATIDPFWQVTQVNGTISTSTDVAYAGSRSAKFESTSGGQRSIDLRHDLGELMYGTVSVQFYDYAPGQQTLYEHLGLYEPLSLTDSSVGVADYDANCYLAAVGATGPGQICGSFPGVYTTSIGRTAGWHEFSISRSNTSISIRIDGTLVFTQAGDFPFQYVILNVFGPSFRPNTVVYWDNFQIDAQSASVPEPATTALIGGGLLVLCLRKLRKGR
jgi:hypothetical protein